MQLMKLMQQALLPVAGLARKLARIHGRTRHDGADGMLIDQLRLAIAPEQHRKIIEPCFEKFS